MVVTDVDPADDDIWATVEERVDTQLNTVGWEPSCCEHSAATHVRPAHFHWPKSGDRLADPGPLLVGDDDFDISESGKGIGEGWQPKSIDTIVVGEEDKRHALTVIRVNIS